MKVLEFWFMNTVGTLSKAVGTPSRVPEWVWKPVPFHRTGNEESPTTNRDATASWNQWKLWNTGSSVATHAVHVSSPALQKVLLDNDANLVSYMRGGVGVVGIVWSLTRKNTRMKRICSIRSLIGWLIGFVGYQTPLEVPVTDWLTSPGVMFAQRTFLTWPRPASWFVGV